MPTNQHGGGNHYVAPGQSKRLAARKGISRNRGQVLKGMGSVRAIRERSIEVTVAAEQGLISAQHANALLRNYKQIVSMMLDEHEMKLRGIRDKAPVDNSDTPPEDSLVLGTHIKRKAVVKKGTAKDGSPIDEKSISLEASGPDAGILTEATREHDDLVEAELEDAMREDPVLK